VATLLEKIEILCSTSEIQMIGINSNDVQAYPYDSTANMVKIAQDYKWRFPYLVDESQKVARVFRATCTPDAFLYDDTNRLYYRGQFDDSRPSNGVANGEDLLHALQEMLNGAQPPAHQKPSTGCNIKWKS